MYREAYLAEAVYLYRHARQARRDGDAGAAVRFQTQAADRVRALVAKQPDDVKTVHELGACLYNLGDILIGAGLADDAVVCLTECEGWYRSLREGEPKADAWIADATIRRAFAYGKIGAGASAMVDAQAAIEGYRNFVEGPDVEAHHLDYTRVLSKNADVLSAFGDPDMGVWAAQVAVRFFEAKKEEAVHPPHVRYYLKALDVADRILVAKALAEPRPLNPYHPARGRTPYGEALLILESRSGTAAGSLLGGGSWTLNAPSLTLTFLSALKTATDVLGPDFLSDRLRRALDMPKEGAVPVIPIARVSDPSMRAEVAAALTSMATALLPRDAMAANRLFLEAHCMLAGSALLSAESMKRYGPVWAQALVAFARHHSNCGHHALALDLAGWARTMTRELAGSAAQDTNLQSLLAECATLGAELLIASGERERGEWMLNARKVDLADMQRGWQNV